MTKWAILDIDDNCIEICDSLKEARRNALIEIENSDYDILWIHEVTEHGMKGALLYVDNSGIEVASAEGRGYVYDLNSFENIYEVRLWQKN